MRDILKEEYQIAESGRKIWLSLKEIYAIDENVYLVIFPMNDHEFNEIALRYLPEFLKRKYINRVVVLHNSQNLSLTSMNNSGIHIEYNEMSQENLDSIIKYYRLVQFAKNIVVISVKEPFGNANIINKAGISVDDYIINAIYV